MEKSVLFVYYFISSLSPAFPKCLFVGGMGDVGVQGRSQPWLGGGNLAVPGGVQDRAL